MCRPLPASSPLPLPQVIHPLAASLVPGDWSAHTRQESSAYTLSGRPRTATGRKNGAHGQACVPAQRLFLRALTCIRTKRGGLAVCAGRRGQCWRAASSGRHGAIIDAEAMPTSAATMAVVIVLCAPLRSERRSLSSHGSGLSSLARCSHGAPAGTQVRQALSRSLGIPREQASSFSLYLRRHLSFCTPSTV